MRQANRFFAASILWCLSASAQTTPKPEDKCSIEGTVVNAITGEPVKKARLLLQPAAENSRIPYATSTNAAGHFLMDEVNPGRYTLTASRVGYSTQPYLPEGNHQPGAGVKLEAGQKLKDIVFKLTPNAVITGVIVDEDGDPMDHVIVECLSYAYQHGRRRLVEQASTGTNDAGEFRLQISKTPGCLIRAAQLSNQTEERPIAARGASRDIVEKYISTYYPNTANPKSASMLAVPAGAQIGGINLTMIRSRIVRITGHVNFGIPACARDQTGVYVLDGQQSEIWNEQGPDAAGNFVMTPDLAPGSYFLKAACNAGGKPYTTRTPIEIRDANIEGIELTLQPPLEIRGHVTVEESPNGAAPRLVLQSAAGDAASDDAVDVKSDLTFKIENVEPGLYYFGAGATPQDLYIKSVRMGPQDVTETGFDLTAGVAPDEFSVVLSPNGGVIEGSVTNVKDEPASGLLVTLIPDADHRRVMLRYKTANTDKNGHFLIKGVAPGEYKIYAWEEMEESAYADPDFVKPHEADGEAVSIKERGHETVQLKMIPAENTAAAKPVR